MRRRSSNMAFRIPLPNSLSFHFHDSLASIPLEDPLIWDLLLKGTPVLIILQLSPILVMEYLAFIELHLHEGCWVVNELCYFMGSMFRGTGLKVLTGLINQISRIQLDYFNEERMVMQNVREGGGRQDTFIKCKCRSGWKGGCGRKGSLRTLEKISVICLTLLLLFCLQICQPAAV
jgi:hypothetical protein